VIKTADWIIDLGPEGGAGGGKIIAQGTPEQVAAVAESYTGRYLKPVLNRRASKRASVPVAAPVRNGRERKQPADLLGE
jgi:excinuclease ABC subunit A